MGFDFRSAIFPRHYDKEGGLLILKLNLFNFVISNFVLMDLGSEFVFFANVKGGDIDLKAEHTD